MAAVWGTRLRLGVAAAVLAVAAVVLLAPAGRAWACSCMTTTVEQAVADGVAAFVGSPRDARDEAPRRWTFDVEQVVKGEVAGRVEVWQTGQGECGPSFTIGELVGVVVQRDGDRYVTDDCGGVWLADELRSPGVLAAPTGRGPVAVIAAGRTGSAVLAAYDDAGDLAAWALGEPTDEMRHLRLCPGSSVFVGLAGGAEPRLVRRDVASLATLDTVVLTGWSPERWPTISDPRAVHCVSADGDVVVLVSASGYGGDDDDDAATVVWVDGAVVVEHRLEHAWDLAPVGDGRSAVVLAGPDGTDVEQLNLADGTRRLLTPLPDRLGGRLVAVEPASGRLAVIATTNPTLHARGDPGAPDDRLVVLGVDGIVHSTATLDGTRLAQSIEWVDPERLRIVWSLPVTIVEIVELDGTVQSATSFDTTGEIVGVADRTYVPTDDGVLDVRLDGGRRLLTPGIARVHDVLAVPAGPIAAPQPTPTAPAQQATTAPPQPATTAPPAGAAPLSDDDGRSTTTTIVVVIGGLLLVAVVTTALLRGRRRRDGRSSPRS